MMWLMFGVFFAACLASLILTPLSIHLSHRLCLLDEPDARKVHKSAVPRLGGIGIVGGALLIAIPGFVYFSSIAPEATSVVSRQHVGILLGALCVFAVGLTDDLSPVSSRLKLVALLAASFAVCGAGGAFSELRTDGQPLADYSTFSWVLTAFWISGIAVAFNFIDGLDGLSGGLGLMASVVLAIFLIAAGQYASAIAPLALAGAILGFLFFNWHPAKTFMGDGGSMTIGFLLGAMTVTSNSSLGTMRAMVLPGLALSVALVDSGLTLFRRRYQQRRSMFSAERGHIHHRLLDSGLTHKQAVMVIHAVSAAAVLIGMVSLSFEGWATIGGLLLIIPLLWGLFHAAGSVRTNEMVSALRRKHQHDRTSRRFRQAFESLQLEFDAARNFREWWQVVCNAADRLEFSSVELPVGSQKEGESRIVRWVNPSEDCQHDVEQIDAKIPVTIFGDAQPSRVAAVRIPAAICLESAGQRLAHFSRLMAENGRESLRNIHLTATANKFNSKLEPAGEFGDLRVALVHDYFETYGGPEKVVEQIIKIFPHCDLFSLFDFLPESQRGFLQGKTVTTTFIQKLPFARTKHASYLPLMPLAIEQLDLSQYDIVISSSHLVAKGVITGPDQLHICYCHSPVRHGWDPQHRDTPQPGYSPRGMLARVALHYLRNWDARSSLGVDHFIANSRFVGRRIEKVYRRQAEVIHPPVDTEAFSPGSEGPSHDKGYYLVASRLAPYKRIDLIVEAFTLTPERKLVVVGAGPELARLKHMAGPNVQLVGYLDQQSLVRYMQDAKAFVFAAEEDFGIVTVEAMACGLPVIAYGKGGVTESIKEGATGYFFDEQTPHSLIDAVERFEASEPVDDLDRKAACQRAERYSVEQFTERLTDSVRRELRVRWPRHPQRLRLDKEPPTPTPLLSGEQPHPLDASASGVDQGSS